MVQRNAGTFKLSHECKTGILSISADLVKDSSFPLKEGKVMVRIEGNSIIIAPKLFNSIASIEICRDIKGKAE